MIEKREVEVAKEIDDVGILIVSLVTDIKAGKDPVSIGQENLDELMAAIKGIDQVDEEIADNLKIALSTIGARAGELAYAIIGKQAKDKGKPPVV
jgi:septation ring formation regulator EzrA